VLAQILFRLFVILGTNSLKEVSFFVRQVSNYKCETTSIIAFEIAGINLTVMFLLFMLRDEVELYSFENYATSGACESNRLHTLYLQGAISVAGALQSALLPTAE
jgi:hypothetical protein